MAMAASRTISPTQKLTTIRIRPTTPTAIAIFEKRDTVCLLLRGKAAPLRAARRFPTSWTIYLNAGQSSGSPPAPLSASGGDMPLFAPWTRSGGPPGRPGWCSCTGGIHDALAAHRRRRQRAAVAQPAGAADRHAARPAGDAGEGLHLAARPGAAAGP